MRCRRTLCALVFLVGCATTADPPAEVRRKTKKTPTPATAVAAGPASPDAGAEVAAASDEPAGPRGIVAAAPSAPEAFGDVGFKEVTEKDWLAGIRNKVAEEQKIDASELRFSPGRLRAAFVKSPPVTTTKPGRRAPLRRHQIIVVDNQGQKVGTFRAITAPKSDEPPKELRFLSEDRLVYEVVASLPPEGAATPPTAKAAKKLAARGRKASPRGRDAKHAAKKSRAEPARAATDKPAPPRRLFVIQPIAPRARPIRCEGFYFSFPPQHDRLAFVAGQPEAAFVAVDAAQVYPRRGKTVVSSAPVWSKDGRSLAFLESPPEKPTRLVLLAEFDNPTGDTTWDLPADSPVDGTRVFWAGSGKLVVGKTVMRPIFSASFVKENPR